MEKVREYALKHYASRFARSSFSVDVRGKKTWKRWTVEPMIEEFDSHYTVKAHKDESPIILSKNF